MSGRAAHDPTRTCVGCGRRAAQRELVRLQVDPDGGMFAVGSRHARAGRSAYVHEHRDCVNRLVKSRLLGRSLRTAVDPGARAAIVEDLCAALDAAASATAGRPDAQVESN